MTFNEIKKKKAEDYGQVWEQVRRQIDGQVNDQVWEQVIEQVEDQVLWQVWRQVLQQVMEQVGRIK